MLCSVSRERAQKVAPRAWARDIAVLELPSRSHSRQMTAAGIGCTWQKNRYASCASLGVDFMQKSRVSKGRPCQVE